MFLNLKIEFLKKQVSIDDAAKAIGLHRNTLANKINGKCRFYLDEIEQLQKIYFYDCSLEYLCKKGA